MKKLILFALSVAVIGTVNAQSNDGAKTASKGNPIVIGMTNSIYVAKSQLILDPMLHMPASQKDYTITSYMVSYLPAGKGNDVMGPFGIKGDAMNTGRAAEILSKVQPGDRLYFEDIVAESSDKTKQPMKLIAAVMVQ
jgi:hypothetical protein